MTTETEERTAWLASLKVGDEVAYQSYGFAMCSWRTATILSRTKAGWIKTGKWTFAADGRCRGHERGAPHNCVPVTQAIRDDIEKHKLVQEIDCIKLHWAGMPLEKLREVAATMKSW